MKIVRHGMKVKVKVKKKNDAKVKVDWGEANKVKSRRGCGSDGEDEGLCVCVA